MKRLRRLTLAASLLLAPAALAAQTVPAAKSTAQTVPASKPAPQTAEDEDRIFRYNSAIGLLKKGRDFERAIGLLRGLTEQSPQDRSYHLALGCAYELSRRRHRGSRFPQ